MSIFFFFFFSLGPAQLLTQPKPGKIGSGLRLALLQPPPPSAVYHATHGHDHRGNILNMLFSTREI
eukprot:11184512-Lingulodinium_polyedra.AAC.1